MAAVGDVSLSWEQVSGMGDITLCILSGLKGGEIMWTMGTTSELCLESRPTATFSLSTTSHDAAVHIARFYRLPCSSMIPIMIRLHPVQMVHTQCQKVLQDSTSLTI